MGFDGLKDLLTQIVLLQQMLEAQDRGLVRDPVADQIDAGKAAHGGHLGQGLFHRWIAERIPLLQQVDAQHRRQRIWRAATFGRRLVVNGTNQGEKEIPRQRGLHLLQEDLPPRLLLGVGLLIIRKTQLEGDRNPFPVSS